MDMRYELYDYYNAPCGRSATMEELKEIRSALLAEPDTDEMPAVGEPCSYDAGNGLIWPICGGQGL